MSKNSNRYVSERIHQEWIFTTKEMLSVLGLRQEDLAKRMGVSRSIITMYLNKSRPLTLLYFYGSISAIRSILRNEKNEHPYAYKVSLAISSMEEMHDKELRSIRKHEAMR